MTRLTVDTRHYERNNAGRKPKAGLVGSWAFGIGGEIDTRFYRGRYADVVRQAKADARAAGVDTVVVMP